MRLKRESSAILEKTAAWLGLAIVATALTFACLAVWAMTAYGETAGSASSATGTASAAINSNKVVTVSGVLSSGAGRPVSVRITDPNGKLEYVSNATTASDGSYSFSYTMSNTATGTYTVTVGAPGLAIPLTTSFVYNTGPASKATVNAAIDSSKVVTVSGTIGTAGGQPVSVMITDPDGKPEYVSNTTTESGGSYSFSYTMPINAATGTYTVTVGAPGLASPVTTSFDYSTGPAINATVNAGKVVTVSGTTGTAGGQPVSVMINDPHGKLEYVNNTTTTGGGKFSFSYTMFNTAVGIYQVVAGSPLLSAPLTASFVLPSADLTSLELNGQGLSPPFGSAITAYTADVTYGVSSVTVTPTAADALAVIDVNGATVASGSASGPIALNVGSNRITVGVTSSDKTLTKTYTVTVTRQAWVVSGGGGPPVQAAPPVD